MIVGRHLVLLVGCWGGGVCVCVTLGGQYRRVGDRVKIREKKKMVNYLILNITQDIW